MKRVLGTSPVLPPSHLWRVVAADRGGAGTGNRARDVAVLAVAARPWWVPGRAVAGWRRWLLWWWLWRWWLLRRWLLLGSSVVAASVVGVVVIPAIVTPAVLVVATTSTPVETCIGRNQMKGLSFLSWTCRSWADLVTAAAPVCPGTEQKFRPMSKQSTPSGSPQTPGHTPPFCLG